MPVDAAVRGRLHDVAARDGSHRGRERTSGCKRPLPPRSEGAVVEVRDLVKRFGDFTAVDHVTFEVRRGEIFGLLGPNGAGKTTTFRMLCGLLPPSGGTLKVAGVDVRHGRRRRARSASATSRRNSRSTARSRSGESGVLCQRLRPARRAAARAHRLGAAAVRSRAPRERPSGELPGGFKQRLAMAAALLHEPDILFLDEPTSGADPLARRDFWRRITALAEEGVTVIVTTHFMEEAEYCDHVASWIRAACWRRARPPRFAAARAPSGPQAAMEDAFIADRRGSPRQGGADARS